MSARDDYPIHGWLHIHGQAVIDNEVLSKALDEIDELRAGKCQTLAECIRCCIRVDHEAETDRFMDAIGGES